MKFKPISLALQIIIIISSFAVSTTLFFDNMLPTDKSFIPFLPLIFGLGSIFFIKVFNHIFDNIAITIIVFTFYIRMVIMPFFMQFSDYERNGLAVEIEEYYNVAVLLMVYEYLLVFCVMSLVIVKVKRNLSIESSIFSWDFSSQKVNIAKKILTVITFFTFTSIVFYPDILNNYKFFVFFSEEESINWYRNYYQAMQNVPTLVYYLTTWCIDILKNLWVLILMIDLRKKGEKPLHLFLSIFLIFINALISSGNTAYSLYFSIALLIVLITLYQSFKKIIIMATFVLLTLIGIFGLISVSFASSGNSLSPLASISNTLQAYFTGPANVAIALMIGKVNVFTLIYADFSTSLPLLRTFFIHLNNSTEIFNFVMYQKADYGGQIIPSVGLGKVYFGYLFSPVFSCLSVYYAVVFGYKSFKESHVPYRFLYQFISIVLACMPVLYNSFIFSIVFFTYILPTWLLIKFLGRA